MTLGVVKNVRALAFAFRPLLSLLYEYTANSTLSLLQNVKHVQGNNIVLGETSANWIWTADKWR